MIDQRHHTTRSEAERSARQMAESCYPWRLATIFLIGPGRYVAAEYQLGDELQWNALVIVSADGSQVDADVYAKNNSPRIDSRSTDLAGIVSRM